ncbi:sporozoite surface protein 2-like isoform X2 [Cherax quadricarinatus]|uniref:sporozoite surface protein 2-like isoform X2 n=1 Tax=Cherax quadricarinatus TaxID=27406 RepID=UPI00387EAF9B
MSETQVAVLVLVLEMTEGAHLPPPQFIPSDLLTQDPLAAFHHRLRPNSLPAQPPHALTVFPTHSKPNGPIPQKPISPNFITQVKPKEPFLANHDNPFQPIPIPNKPFQPIPNKPFQPIPNKPFQPIPNKPFQPIPNKPFQSIPNKPLQSIPNKPFQPIHNQPFLPPHPHNKAFQPPHIHNKPFPPFPIQGRPGLPAGFAHGAHFNTPPIHGTPFNTPTSHVAASSIHPQLPPGAGLDPAVFTPFRQIHPKETAFNPKQGFSALDKVDVEPALEPEDPTAANFFPSEGYDLDSYFDDFPVFGYFDFVPNPDKEKVPEKF